MKPEPHARRNLAWALAWAASAAFVAGAALGGAARAQTPVPVPTPRPSSCVAIQMAAVGGLTAPVWFVGEAIDVTAKMTTLCAGRKAPLHVVLVLDGSQSMAGEPNQSVRKAAREFIDRLDLKDNPTTQVGVVVFNGEAKILCQLTNRASQASGCVGRVGAAGGSDIAAGIREGQRVLHVGRATFEDPSIITEVIVLVTDGANAAGCQPVIDAADAVKGEGVRLMTVCVTDACDADCVRRAASEPSHHFVASGIHLLNQVIASISRRLNGDVRTVVMDHAVSPGFEIVPGSMLLAPTQLDAGHIRWVKDFDARQGMTVSYQLRAHAAVRRAPIWLSNSIDFTDMLGGVGHAESRTPIVDIVDPSVPAVPEPGDLLLAERSLTIAPALVQIGARLDAELRFTLPVTPTFPATTTARTVAHIVLRVPAHLRIESATAERITGFEPDRSRVGWWLDTDSGWPSLLTATLRAASPGDGAAAVVAYRPSGSVEPYTVLFTAVSAPVRVIAPVGFPTATAPPNRIRGRIYLPLAVSETCAPAPPTDAVIVVDTSTSMGERLPDGTTKLAATAAAVGAMIDRMNLSADRFALVSFDRAATVRLGFTTERGDVVRAVAGAALADGTAIDAGVRLAAQLLGGPTRRAGSRGVIVVVTDGRSYPAPPAAAVAEAETAKAAGVTVFAVGIGNEVDRATMTGIASSIDHARFTASAAEERLAFEGVAALLRCARTGNWGGRVN